MSVLKIKQGDEWISLLGDSVGESKPTPLVAADWNQNDPSALDYVKNRTHYEYGTRTHIHALNNCFCPLYEDEMMESAPIQGLKMAAIPETIQAISSFKYTITINGNVYENIPYASMAGVGFFGDYMSMMIAIQLGGSLPEEMPFIIATNIKAVNGSDYPFNSAIITTLPPQNGGYNITIETVQPLVTKEILPKSTIITRMGQQDGTMLGEMPGMSGLCKSFKLVDGMDYQVMYDNVTYNLKGRAISLLESVGGGAEEILMLSMLTGGDIDLNMYCLGNEAIALALLTNDWSNILNDVNTFRSFVELPFCIMSIPFVKIAFVFDLSAIFPNQIKLEKIVDDISSEVILPLSIRMGQCIPYMGFVWHIDCNHELVYGEQYKLTTRNYVYTAYVEEQYDSNSGEYYNVLNFYEAGHTFINTKDNRSLIHYDSNYAIDAVSTTHTVEVTGTDIGIKKLDPKFGGGGSGSLLSLLLGGIMSTGASGYSLRKPAEDEVTFANKIFPKTISKESLENGSLLSKLIKLKTVR